MTQEEFVIAIKEEIRKGGSLLQRFENLKLVSYNGRWRPDEAEKQNLKNKLHMWEDYVQEVLKSYLGKTHSEMVESFSLAETNKWYPFKEDGIRHMNDNLTTLKSILNRLAFIDMDRASNDVDGVRGIGCSNSDRPYKVFISHSSEDGKFVDAFVSLLEFIGIRDSEKLFCSSITGFMVPNSKNIRDHLLKQFTDYKPFVILLLSSNYYESPYCLNEMGATWGLGAEFCPILVKGFEYNDMKGVINGEYASIKVDASDAKARLNELKDKLISSFQLDSIDASRWEEKRDDFLKTVNNIPTRTSSNKNFALSNVKEEPKISYLHFINEVYEKVDIVNYDTWMANWIQIGKPTIKKQTYNNLITLKDDLNKVAYDGKYKDLESLLTNLQLLLDEYLTACNYHKISKNEEEYTIERFYETYSEPERRKKVCEFEEYIWLIRDLSFELSRLLNLLLEKVRTYIPHYILEYGIMTIKGEKRKDIEYADEEKSSSPYPGLKLFVEVTRFTRSICLGKTKDINSLNLRYSI